MNVKFRRLRGYKTKQRSFSTPELFPFAHDVVRPRGSGVENEQQGPFKRFQHLININNIRSTE